jgi:hypothetical protein
LIRLRNVHLRIPPKNESSGYLNHHEISLDITSRQDKIYNFQLFKSANIDQHTFPAVSNNQFAPTGEAIWRTLLAKANGSPSKKKRTAVHRVWRVNHK